MTPPPAPAVTPFAPAPTFAFADMLRLPTFESLPTRMPSVPTPTVIEVLTPWVFFPSQFFSQQHLQGSLQQQSFLPLQQSFDPNRQQPVRATASAPAVTATLTDFVMILFIVHLRFVSREEPFLPTAHIMNFSASVVCWKYNGNEISLKEGFAKT